MEEKYNYYKKIHPDWNHEQIMTAISITMSAENEISKAGPDVTPDNSELILSILQNARDWLKEVLPDVFKRVAGFFDVLINNIGYLVGKGLGYIIDAIDYLYRKSKFVIDTIKASVENKEIK